MSSWADFLHCLGATADTEIDEPTFHRTRREQDGHITWSHRTLDFIVVAFDRVVHANWQSKVEVFAPQRYSRASDHKAVRMQMQERRAPQYRRRRAQDRDLRPLPEWLFRDDRFVTEYRTAMSDWEAGRGHGLQGLREFVDLTRQMGRDWLRERVVEATCDDHRFEVCMSAQFAGCRRGAVAIGKVSRWFAIYPRLRELVEIEIKLVDSSVYVISTQMLVDHIYQLADNVAQERAQDARDSQVNGEDSPHTGATLQGGKPYPRMSSDLRALLPCQRHQIVGMWDETHTTLEHEPKRIGEIIHRSGIARSGQARGQMTRGQRMLENWSADFSSCRTEVRLCEVMNLLLSIRAHKRPGTTGVCGCAYRMHAPSLAPVFLEAAAQLQDVTLEEATIPVHLHETLWVPIAKNASADVIGAVRDLELPNEDAKLLERMHTLLLNECISTHVLPQNQAFVPEGDIMHNVVGLHEEFRASTTKRDLQLLLLLDCTKGFNLVSHSWTRRVFEQSGLPAALQRSIFRLVETQFATLVFGGLVFSAVQWLCGYRQGGPLSGIIYIIIVAPFLAALANVEGVRRVWGFCDDWEASISGIRPVREINKLVKEFEAASGQEVNKRKTTWLPNRHMSVTERRALREYWPDAVIVERQCVLGTPLGHGVTTADFVGSALEEFQRRIVAFSSSRLSFAMRVLAVNIFLYPLFSYVTRLLVLPIDVQHHVVNSAMRFVSRVPFCKATVFIHARSLFGIPIALRAFAIDNLAGVIATAKRLEASGTLHSDMIQAWRQESHSDVEARSMHNMPRPLTHFAIAYDSFHVMTGSTVDDFLRRRQRRQIRRTQRTHTQHSPFHQWLYEEMLRYDREHAFDYLHARLRDRGIEWTMVHDNLRRLPRAVPQAHRTS